MKGLDEQVRDLDQEFHDTVFVDDTAIARCLASDAPPPEDIDR